MKWRRALAFIEPDEPLERYSRSAHAKLRSFYDKLGTKSRVLFYCVFVAMPIALLIARYFVE